MAVRSLPSLFSYGAYACLELERSRLMRCEWDAKDFETLDFRKRLGRIWRNQLQHGSLNISADKPIERAGVRYRKLDI